MNNSERFNMFLTLEMLETRARQLGEYRYVGLRPVTPLAAMESTAGPDEVHAAPPKAVAGGTLELGDAFNGRDRYLWARAGVELPPPLPGHDVVGLFDFGETGGGHNSGFESLLYLNGQPWQGVDTNHPDVLLEKYAGTSVELTFLLWTGLEGGGPKREQRHRVRQAHVGYLHRDTDALYYLSLAISQTLRVLPASASERYALAAALEAAFLQLNWDDDKLHASVPAALEVLEARLDAMEKTTPVTVNVVGHTHIDVAWLWRLKHTREKALRSFSTALRLLDEFEEFTFVQSQPQLYSYVEQDCPELFGRIKQAVAGGRWEADGGMWVEADCNISSGEALVRQLTHGAAYFREHFGARCGFLWLPDVFGYSWALPQILKLAGIDSFMTTKISWNQYNTMPHDLFRWRGIDGSEVLTYFITTPDKGHADDARFTSYNGMMFPWSVQGNWEKFKDKELSRDTLLCYGYGDGGGGVNREMLKMRRAMDRLPGLPNVKPARAGDFFKKMHENLENAEGYVPVWDGELYLEYHRGTYTSQAHNKRMNRRLEYAAARAEWLSSLGWLRGEPYDADTLRGAWETILLHQFHDIIPGSSIREVYEDSGIAYAEAEQALTALEKRVAGRLVAREENSYTLWHGGNFACDELVFIPEERAGRFADADGAALPAQRGDGGWWVRAHLPALGLAHVCFVPGEPAPAAPPPFEAGMDAGRLETPLYSLRWNVGGQLVSLFDKNAGREVLAPGAAGNALEVYEDKPLDFDNWDVDVFHTQKREFFVPVGPPTVAACGPEFVALRFEYRYNASSLVQEVVLYRENPRIDFKTRVDWHEKNRLLKAAFPVDIRATAATYDIQFGHVARPTHYNTSWDYARFEVVGHKWADLSEQGYGVSLLNDCKYGYSVKDGVMRLTLLKSGKYPDTEADMGTHEFTYALLPHTAPLAEGPTIAQALALNLPAQVAAGAPAGPAEPLFSFGSDAIVVDAIKKADAEDCVVLRFHECRGGRHSFAVTSAHGMARVAPCNLLEENLAPPVQASHIGVAIKPFEIKTYKVWFA